MILITNEELGEQEVERDVCHLGRAEEIVDMDLKCWVYVAMCLSRGSEDGNEMMKSA
jgi:hypothetical protein